MIIINKKKICKNNYNCSFDCKNCIFDDIKHFKQLINEMNIKYGKNKNYYNRKYFDFIELVSTIYCIYYKININLLE